jgi:hypothetical protein
LEDRFKDFLTKIFNIQPDKDATFSDYEDDNKWALSNHNRVCQLGDPLLIVHPGQEKVIEISIEGGNIDKKNAEYHGAIYFLNRMGNDNDFRVMTFEDMMKKAKFMTENDK